MNDSRLIHCSACNAEIARNAPTCPKCGGINEWIDPKLKAFVENEAEKIDLGGRRFMVYAHRDKLIGYAIPQWRLLQQFVYTSGIAIASVFLGVFAAINGKGDMYGLFWVIQSVAGIYLAILLGAMMLWLGLRLLGSGNPFREEVPIWHEGFGGRSCFELDLSGAQPAWKSDNDAFWEPVRKALFKKL